MSERLAAMAGKANHRETWEFIVGERIDGAFEDQEHNLVIVMRSGVALVLTSLGGETIPAFWVEARHDWERRLDRVRDELLRVQGGLRRLLFAGLDIFPEAPDDPDDDPALTEGSDRT